VLDHSAQPLFAHALYGFESPGATTDVGYLATRLRQIAKAAAPARTIAAAAGSLTH
jgi:hypothetical protein